jgi:hypothetical protein
MFVTSERIVMILGPMASSWTSHGTTTTHDGLDAIRDQYRQHASAQGGQPPHGGANLAHGGQHHLVRYRRISVAMDGHECRLCRPFAWRELRPHRPRLPSPLSTASPSGCRSFGFYMFSGGGVHADPAQRRNRDRPRPSTKAAVQGPVFYNPAFREVWWSTRDTSQTEPSNYVGQHRRLVMDIRHHGAQYGVGLLTLTGQSCFSEHHRDGVIYEHETGVNADGAASLGTSKPPILTSTRATSSLNIDGYIPDFQRRPATST